MGSGDNNPPDNHGVDPFDFGENRSDGPRVIRDVPLFPLNVVLFPQIPLPLHIFEPRYRLMISECIRDNRPFGVVLIRDGAPDSFAQVEPHNVGTLARITEVAKLEDGRFVLNTVGTERFKLLRYYNTKPYMTGDIELWPEGVPQTTGDELLALLISLRVVFERYVEVLIALAHKDIEAIVVPDDPALLSYLVPKWLLIDEEDKQRLLEIHAPDDRLRAEIDVLRDQTAYLLEVKHTTEEQGDIDLVDVDEEIEDDEDEDDPGPNTSSYDIGDHFSRN